MPIFDRVDLACPDIDPTRWPKLSCGAASQLALHDSSLRLEGDRELLFQDGGQIRSFDDTHKLVFNRPSNLLELHERGSIRFLTGSPAPTERMRILANGHVGIGTATPASPLHVTGDLRIDGALRVTGNAEANGDVTVGSGHSIRFELGTGERVSLGSGGAFEIDAPGTAGGRLVVTESGNVGIGTAAPGAKLDVNGNIQRQGYTVLDRGNTLVKSMLFHPNPYWFSTTSANVEGFVLSIETPTSGTCVAHMNALVAKEGLAGSAIYLGPAIDGLIDNGNRGGMRVLEAGNPRWVGTAAFNARHIAAGEHMVQVHAEIDAETGRIAWGSLVVEFFPD
jgi:hypothetical protein